MKPQTKLKVAAEEIKDILKKHDIAGSIALHTPGHAEHLVHMTTSYSCAYQVEDNRVQFFAKAKDFKTPEEHLERLKSTANMLNILTEATAINFSKLKPLTDAFDKLTNAKHS